MNDITALAQSYELLIANGNETANLLRHLADNEFDSDYFAVVSECESYGKETEAELSITGFALRAAGYVDALVEALQARDKQIAELEQRYNRLSEWGGKMRELLKSTEESLIYSVDMVRELESRTVKLPLAVSVGGQGYREQVVSILTTAGIQVIEGEA